MDRYKFIQKSRKRPNSMGSLVLFSYAINHRSCHLKTDFSLPSSAMTQLNGWIIYTSLGTKGGVQKRLIKTSYLTCQLRKCVMHFICKIRCPLLAYFYAAFSHGKPIISSKVFIPDHERNASIMLLEKHFTLLSINKRTHSMLFFLLKYIKLWQKI